MQVYNFGGFMIIKSLNSAYPQIQHTHKSKGRISKNYNTAYT